MPGLDLAPAFRQGGRPGLDPSPRSSREPGACMKVGADTLEVAERPSAGAAARQAYADVLAGLSLFADLAPADRAALLQAAVASVFDKGEAIIDKPAGSALMVLCQGVAALSIDEDRRRAVLAVVAAPRVLNLACVMAGSSPVMPWRAAERCTVVFLPRAGFLDIVSRDAQLAANAAIALAGAYREMVATAAAQRLHSTQERLVDYLLSLPVSPGDQLCVRLPHSKHLLASLLGMTPENLSRTMAALAPYGVSVRGSDIKIEDRQRLRSAVTAPCAGQASRSGAQA